MRPAAAFLALGCMFLAGCGGNAKSGAPRSTSATPSAAPPAGSLEALWRSAPEHPSVIEGSSDYQPGVNRVSFLLVDSKSRVLSSPTASVLLATGLRDVPYERAVARSEPIGVPVAPARVSARSSSPMFALPKAGKYWLLASPTGSSAASAGLANLVVGTKPDAPAIGAHAIPSRTPTAASTGGRLAALSTATHPDPRLYRLSVAQALAQHVPFVLTFATPKFCQSRTCGPVVDVVDAVSKRLAGTPVRFIHVEIYKDNDPAKGSTAG